jgi:hypothetical protein
MALCAAEMNVSKEQLLWTIFQCLNPDFSKVMRMTQMMKAEEQKERMREKMLMGTMAAVV